MLPDLELRVSPGAQAARVGDEAWRLSIPAGPDGQYRLAQIDDYTRQPRSQFPWQPPLVLTLRARASQRHLPGTWGFGFWNDPFILAWGAKGSARRLPALPNAAWFFFASPPNYLSLRDDLPAQGSLAATFCSPLLPAPVLALALPFVPLLLLRPATRQLRKLGRRFVHQDTAILESNSSGKHEIDVTTWQRYTLNWQAELVSFEVGERSALETPIVPNGRLGLVIWIDNQFAAFQPDGRLAFGTLPNPEPAWIEIADIEIMAGSSKGAIAIPTQPDRKNSSGDLR